VKSFEISGPLHGYRAGLNRVFDPKYKRFKEMIRLVANTKGVPSEITPGTRVGIIVDIYWKKKARIDGSNIFKAVEDAIFSQDRGLGFGSWSMTENAGGEFIEVTVSD
jgi:hypothetical protein